MKRKIEIAIVLALLIGATGLLAVCTPERPMPQSSKRTVCVETNRYKPVSENSGHQQTSGYYSNSVGR